MILESQETINSQTALTLVMMVFLLGARHGFEPDHIAIIDSMTRCMKSHLKLSKGVGILFSFGHGLIVIFITILISIQANRWIIPQWLEDAGLFTSVISLFFLGIINFYTSLQPNQKEIKFKSPKSFILTKFIKFNPGAVYIGPIFLGMLFALSFDTLTLTIAFSLSAYALGGWPFPIILGIIFMFGMMLTDGLNGYLVSQLINRAGKKSQLISRVLGLVIGSFSLIICAYYLLFYFKPI